MKKTLLATAVLMAMSCVVSAEELTQPKTGELTYEGDVSWSTKGFEGFFENESVGAVGLISSATLTTKGNVTLVHLGEKGSGYVLGKTTQPTSVTGYDVTLDSKKSVAIASYGQHTVDAKHDLKIFAKDNAVLGVGDMVGSISLNAGNAMTIRSENESALYTVLGTVALTGSTINLESLKKPAITQDGTGSTTVKADHIVVKAFVDGQPTENDSAIKVTNGSLSLTANNTILISDTTNKEAIDLSGGKFLLNAPRITVEGDIASVEQSELHLDGGLVFKGANAEIRNLTGDKATFTVTKADQKVAITNNNQALTVAGNGDVNDAVGIEGMDKIVTLKGKQEGVKVQMAEGMSSAASSAVLDKNGNLTNVQTVTNSILSNTVDIYAGSTLALNRIMMSDLRKRMGDLRSTEDMNGVWARYNGGKFSGARGLENKFNTIEVGADTAALVDGVRLGVAMSYTDSESDMLRGKADMDAFSLAAYGTKFFENGIYADVIGRIAKADTDVSIDGNKNGKMDNLAVSLSGEFGWRFDLSKQVYIEPQTELTYTNIDSDTLKLSSGHEYKFDSVDSLIGRVGVATGIKCPNNKGDVYVRVSAVHEFLGDAKVTSGNDVHKVKGDDTWMEYGLGANFNINKNAYVYTELERSEGATLEEDWRANLGVRIAF